MLIIEGLGITRKCSDYREFVESAAPYAESASSQKAWNIHMYMYTGRI